MLPRVLPKLSATCDNFGKDFAEPVALLIGPSYQKSCKKLPVIQHVGLHHRVTNKFQLYYIKNQLYATLAVLFISHCKITLHVSDAFCVHHQEY